MLRALGRLVVRRPRTVLAATAVLTLGAGLAGVGIESRLSAGGLHDPGSEASRAAVRLERTFDAGPPNLVLLARAPDGSVDDAGPRAAGQDLSARLGREPAVEGVTSYWAQPSQMSPLRSRDGGAALVVARIRGDDDDVQEAARDIVARYRADDGPLRVQVGGLGPAIAQTTDQSKADLRRAELITLPLTAVLLLLVFGGVVSAALPLAVGGIAILGTLLVLRALASVTEVSIFALNITTALGLGLAVDYSLLVLSRYREERATHDVPSAVARTLQTAGRTVLFSAVTVALSLLAMLVFPLGFLRSLAYAGTGVVLVAAAAAVLPLPALLVLLGDRVKGRSRPVGTPGFWYRRAKGVMRHPRLTTAGAVALLVALGLPFLGLQLGNADERGLPSAASARQVAEAVREEFPVDAGAAITVVSQRSLPQVDTASVDAYAAELAALPDVVRVEAVTGVYVDGTRVSDQGPATERYGRADGTWLSVVPDGDPVSETAQDVGRRVRAVPAPFPALVGGTPLALVDDSAALTRWLPVALVLIGLTTFVLLFLMVGSLLVPVKALVLNLLSLSATFGALVWVFQDGSLAGPLGIEATGSIPYAVPMLLFGIAFGLSMDYEVFLLSRIKEEYDVLGDNDEAVARGLDHTGRIVTAAALLVAVVFGAFLAAGVTVVQMIGLGIALAVLVDAFVIRATLVPALMTLAGRANWWAPRRVRRLHLMFGFWEQEPLDVYDLAQRPSQH